MRPSIHPGRWSALLLAGVVLAQEPSPAPDIVLDNVVILLDASGSMAGRMAGVAKMDAAKAALKDVLRRLPPGTQVGLLVFGGAGVTNDWVYPLGPKDDDRLLTAIEGPQPKGGTPLGAYIKRAADRLLEERQRQYGYGTFRLLIVTDGEAQDQALVERYTPEVMARGVTVDVIGVAMSQQHTLATRVHSYRSANDPAALERAIAEVLAEIGGAASDPLQTELFAELAPLPEAVARAALVALSTSGNEPIGERASPAPPPPSTRTVQAPAPASPSSSPGTPATRIVWAVLGTLACAGLTGVVILALLVRAVSRKRRR